MRILFVIGNLGDYHVPRYEALVRLASSRGDDVSLVEVFGKSGVYEFPQDRREKFFSDRPEHTVTLLADAGEADGHWFKVSLRLCAVVRKFKPDVVVTLGYSTSYSICLCLLKMASERFSLIYMSDSKADDGKRNAVKEWLKRQLVSRFDGALVAGEKHRAYARSLGIPMERSRVGFDVIDVEYFARLSRAANANVDEVRARHQLPQRYILCVSRFVERKNVDLVIEAYAKSGLDVADVSLVLVGQGPDEQKVLEQIRRLGLESRVVILSSVANQEMPGLYACAEFVVLASQFDQWGLCINEAFAAGKPAIVTRTCGVADELVLDDINGFVVEPGDVATLTHRIRLLGSDTALRERFAHNAVSLIRNWTPLLFAENLIDLAESLTGSAGRTRDVR